ncbi:gamma-glutamylputrescine synthetase [Natrinema amylolyticum]|uniref:gamma-glutamylputrescine synthetase n=1 Tax=Natrinema amylolyticum TaxID=2878679 RepID=UPI001CFA4AED|nr:gamma-glutamylputrescine synthetase [Natrinema amylolyticum]
MEVQTIAERCEQADVKLVRLLYVGNDGVIHGHSVKRSHLEDGLESGVPLPKLVQSFNALGQRIKDANFDAVGEVRLVPDRSTFRVLDHEENVAAVCCSLREMDSDTPWSAGPRSALERLVSAFEDDDVVPSLALESEFHVYSSADGGQPDGDRGLYTTDSMRNSHDVVLDAIDALESQGIDVKKHVAEYSPGQNEIVTGHREGVGAVDDYVFLRETIAGVADSHDLQTTFLPHPFEATTNGCHIHLSLWDETTDTNRFAPTNADEPLSRTGRHFVGGILDHIPALLALTSPTVNSYVRLQPQAGAAAYSCWGVGNREAAVRVPQVPSDERDMATRIEFRPADNTANPYLSVLGLLAAGRDGIRNETDPGEPLDADPGNCDDELLKKRGIQRLPTTLGEALDALADDDVLRAAMGEHLFESYLAVKRSEWEEFTSSAATWERDTLRQTF